MVGRYNRVSRRRNPSGRRQPSKDFATKEDFEAAVVGRAATLMFTHNESNGKTYANLDVCTPLEDASKAFVAKDYQTYNEVAPF